MGAPPLFSVVIPTFNRAEVLGRSLDSWQAQCSDGPTFEVVIVDDGSCDETREILGRVRPRRFTMRTLTQENSGPAAARNRALDHVRGEFVLFSGDDIQAEKDLLQQHLKAHEKAAEATTAILGLTTWPEDLPVTATMRHIDGVGAQQFSYHWLKDGEEYDFRHFYTSNISIRREVLAKEPEGFSVDFPDAAFEDAEFAYRLAGHGMRIRYCAPAVARHHHPYTPRSFFARQKRCGRMAALLWRKNPALAGRLSIRDLEWIRLKDALVGRLDRSGPGPAAPDLECWEEAVLRLASIYDTLNAPPDAQDVLLLALFRYAFFRGLAEGLHEGEVARRSAAASFVALIPAAVKLYSNELEKAGLPCPAEDSRLLAGLAH